MMDAMLDQGRATLDQMKNQNFTLKAAKRKMLDIGTKIGLSSSLVGVIDRRQPSRRSVAFYSFILSESFWLGFSDVVEDYLG